MQICKHTTHRQNAKWDIQTNDSAEYNESILRSRSSFTSWSLTILQASQYPIVHFVVSSVFACLHFFFNKLCCARAIDSRIEQEKQTTRQRSSCEGTCGERPGLSMLNSSKESRSSRLRLLRMHDVSPLRWWRSWLNSCHQLGSQLQKNTMNSMSSC